MNAVLALYLKGQFAVTERSIGFFFIYVGGLSLVIRALLLGSIGLLCFVGGILVGLGDGSVRLVSQGISNVTWARAIDPKDGLHLGNDW